MKSFIEDIYLGKHKNHENIEAGEKYREVYKEYGKIYDKLEEGLNKEQKQLLDELFIEGGGLQGAMACTHFKEGFKLGMLVAIEVLSE